MMRAALFGLGLLIVAGALALSYRARQAEPAKPIAPRAQSCSDDCEQRAIVERFPDEWLRACITRCGDRPPLPSAGGSARGLGRDVRSVTRAPADHRR